MDTLYKQTPEYKSNIEPEEMMYGQVLGTRKQERMDVEESRNRKIRTEFAKIAKELKKEIYTLNLKGRALCAQFS